MDRRARWTFDRSAEVALSVGLVLLCLLLFLGILAWKFPEGRRLTDLIRKGTDRTLHDDGDRHLALDMGEFGEDEVVATLTMVRNKVKHRPHGEIAWQDSRPGLALHHRQGVQTFAASGATISFDEGNVLQLGENSLVVVRNTGSLMKAERRRRAVVVLEGSLVGQFAAGGARKLDVELLAGAGESKIRPAASDEEPVEFTAVVGEGGETTLSMHEGEAEVVAGDRTVVVKANESVVMTKDRKVTGPAALPATPRPESPADGYSETYRSRPPPVRFSWSESANSDRYRLSVARDPEFRDLVYEEDLTATELTHRQLSAGTYFWRVRGVRADAVGTASPPRRLVLESDREPPKLEVAFPQGFVEAPEVVMKGVTDPGTRIFIADRPVEVDRGGRFEQTLRLERGANMIVVEAVDESGNTTYRSGLIHARY